MQFLLVAYCRGLKPIWAATNADDGCLVTHSVPGIVIDNDSLSANCPKSALFHGSVRLFGSWAIPSSEVVCNVQELVPVIITPGFRIDVLLSLLPFQI
jgi:hypothetical protein